VHPPPIEICEFSFSPTTESFLIISGRRLIPCPLSDRTLESDLSVINVAAAAAGACLSLACTALIITNAIITHVAIQPLSALSSP